MLAAASAGYAAYRWLGNRPLVLAPRAPLLLGRVVNTTGNGLFDTALDAAVEIAIRQSPYLNIVPASSVRAASKAEGLPPDRQATAAPAPALCRRLGAAASIVGSVASSGPGFVVAIDARACEDGRSLAHAEADAPAEEAVLDALSVAAARVRGRLGEPRESIERFGATVRAAATASLDALQAYAAGVAALGAGRNADAISELSRALDLDQGFALPAARLAAVYADQHDSQQAQRYMKQAYAAAGSLTEPDRLSVTAAYHDIVTGRLEEVIATCETWTKTYPDDWVPHHRLSAAYARAGRMSEALAEARDAARLAPGEIEAHERLARTLLAMDRADDARAAVQEAEDAGLDSTPNRTLLYRLAFGDGDRAAMDRQVQAAAARPDGYLVTAEAARAAAAAGEHARSRRLFAQAIEGARSLERADDAGRLMAERAVDAALLGEIEVGRRDMFASVDLSTGPDTLWMASLAASLAGLTSEAIQLAVGYAGAVPPAPDVVATLRPVLEASIALSQHDSKTAEEALDRAEAFAGAAGPWVPYLRGLAALADQQPLRAATAFRAAAERRVRQPISVIQPLAHLQLARILRASGDIDGAREEYADLGRVWKSADAGLPLVAAFAREAAADSAR
ncbi:MAG: hypothetical protein IT176_09710 [Acidobacteria bacterium]|nr:hypothetical protein [Acidobacteriota bacterium]